jgi:DNA-binding Xre family transcriptional regulator
MVLFNIRKEESMNIYKELRDEILAALELIRIEKCLSAMELIEDTGLSWSSMNKLKKGEPLRYGTLRKFKEYIKKNKVS